MLLFVAVEALLLFSPATRLLSLASASKCDLSFPNTPINPKNGLQVSILAFQGLLGVQALGHGAQELFMLPAGLWLGSAVCLW